MKLIQLNAWQGRLINSIVPFLKAEQPDFICLNEIYSSRLETPLLNMFQGLEHISAAFPGYQVFFSPTHSMSVLGEYAAYGNAILSRWPITDRQTHFIHGQYTEWDSVAHYVNNIRNLQVATIDIDGKHMLQLCNMHGYWEPNTDGSNVSAEVMEAAATHLRNLPKPIILAGDMNLSYNSVCMEPVQTLLYDLAGEQKTSTTLSSLSSVDKDAPCDHILTSDGVTVRHFAVRDAMLVSDHLPLALEFDL